MSQQHQQYQDVQDQFASQFKVSSTAACVIELVDEPQPTVVVKKTVSPRKSKERASKGLGRGPSTAPGRMNQGADGNDALRSPQSKIREAGAGEDEEQEIQILVKSPRGKILNSNVRTSEKFEADDIQ